jgi:hypothetical protein
LQGRGDPLKPKDTEGQMIQRVMPSLSLCRQWHQTRGHIPFQYKRKHPDGDDAYKPVLFQFVSGAFHIDVLLGREPFADLKTR